jgi:hypothetical protein
MVRAQEAGPRFADATLNPRRSRIALYTYARCLASVPRRRCPTRRRNVGHLAGPGQAAGIDGPGSYYMFRSFDTGAPFTPDQQQACVDHYGARPWSPLNAGLFGFTGDAHGRIVDQKASYLGPAIACTSPSPTPGLLELFGTTWPPGSPIAGLTSFTSQCAPSPAPTPGVLLVNCRGSLGPDAASRVAGGFVASNTVSNPRNLPGAPTGSLWTTYVLRDGGKPLAAPAGGVPAATTGTESWSGLLRLPHDARPDRHPHRLHRR